MLRARTAPFAEDAFFATLPLAVFSLSSVMGCACVYLLAHVRKRGSETTKDERQS